MVPDRVCLRIVERGRDGKAAVIVAVVKRKLILRFDPIRELIPQSFGLLEQKFVLRLQVLVQAINVKRKIISGLDHTYAVWVGIRTAEPTEIICIIVVSFGHVALTDVFFLMLRQRGFLMHSS